MTWAINLTRGTAAYSIAASQNQRIRVVAGPGTGKSFAMKRRVARLLESGVDPASILPVTFTRVAAEDLHRELVGMEAVGCEDIEATTLHSLCLSVLLRNHVLATTGRVARPLNDFELDPLVCDLKGAHGGKREVGKRKQAYEAAWARLQHEQAGYAQDPEDATFASDLLSWLRFHSAMLIGEVIPLVYEYLRINPAAPERREYAHILVDEFQDLNKAEQGVVEFLSDNASVCIVGDDDQSIYSFKHAHPAGIQNWIQTNVGAEDVGLAECRRCPIRIVHMANSLISHNRHRPNPRALVPVPEKGDGRVQIFQYATLHDEVNGIANLVEQLVAGGAPPGDVLVLAQRSVIGTPIFDALNERAVPAHSYYAEAELDAEDAQRRFAILKLFVDREDKVALRWLLGYGHPEWRSAPYGRVKEYCEQFGSAPWATMEMLSNRTLALPYTGPLIEAFDDLCDELAALEQLPTLAGVIDRIFPADLDLVRELRAVAVAAIEEIAEGDRRALLSRITTAISQPEIPSEIEHVRIMSLHKSKGLSSAVTIIAGCIEGLLPKQPEANIPRLEAEQLIEEQRRLFYVGISRVKASPDIGKPGTLILTSSRTMTVREAMGAGITPASTRRGTAYLHASRFIGELGDSAPAPIAS